MKNRTMARKLERARVQAREAAAIEFGKVCYLTQPSKRELRASALDRLASHAQNCFVSRTGAPRLLEDAH
jgi:hypothetical protein